MRSKNKDDAVNLFCDALSQKLGDAVAPHIVAYATSLATGLPNPRETLPSYAVDLLIAARHVLFADSLRNPKTASREIRNLYQAVLDFEKRMPTVSGVVQETGCDDE